MMEPHRLIKPFVGIVAVGVIFGVPAIMLAGLVLCFLAATETLVWLHYGGPPWGEPCRPKEEPARIVDSEFF